MSPPADAPAGRALSVKGYIAIFLVYLVIVQGVSLLSAIGADSEYGEFPDISSVLRFLWLPVGVSAIFVAGVVTWLGWWRPVLRDDDRIPPLPRWVWVVPAVMALAILVSANYAELADRGLGYVAVGLVGALFIGFGEETMFRGLGVTTFRAAGFTEVRVALWSSVIFGMAHSTNLFTEGAGATLQVVVTVAAGFFFYLIRRLGRGLLLPIGFHAVWDYALFSGKLGDDTYALSAVFLVVDVILVAVLLFRRRKLELDGPPEPVAAPA